MSPRLSVKAVHNLLTRYGLGWPHDTTPLRWLISVVLREGFFRWSAQPQPLCNYPLPLRLAYSFGRQHVLGRTINRAGKLWAPCLLYGRITGYTVTVYMTLGEPLEENSSSVRAYCMIFLFCVYFDFSNLHENRDTFPWRLLAAHVSPTYTNRRKRTKRARSKKTQRECRQRSCCGEKPEF